MAKWETLPARKEKEASFSAIYKAYIDEPATGDKVSSNWTLVSVKKMIIVWRSSREKEKMMELYFFVNRSIWDLSALPSSILEIFSTITTVFVQRD